MKWKEKAAKVRNEVYILYLAFKDRRTPWYAKALIIAVVAYALSPVDLIPDFIPVIGYIDDLVLIPSGVFLAKKLIPREVMEEYRTIAVRQPISSRSKWIAALVIIAAWLLVIYLIIKSIRLQTGS
jgi:uncharacterized membrane protein YkvA (DUF1232 family)